MKEVLIISLYFFSSYSVFLFFRPILRWKTFRKKGNFRQLRDVKVLRWSTISSFAISLLTGIEHRVTLWRHTLFEMGAFHRWSLTRNPYVFGMHWKNSLIKMPISWKWYQSIFCYYNVYFKHQMHLPLENSWQIAFNGFIVKMKMVVLCFQLKTVL